MGFGAWEVRDLMTCIFVFSDGIWSVRYMTCMTCIIDRHKNLCCRRVIGDCKTRCMARVKGGQCLIVRCGDIVLAY